MPHKNILTHFLRQCGALIAESCLAPIPKNFFFFGKNKLERLTLKCLLQKLFKLGHASVQSTLMDGKVIAIRSSFMAVIFAALASAGRGRAVGRTI